MSIKKIIKRVIGSSLLLIIPTILSSCLDDPYYEEPSGSNIFDDDDGLDVKTKYGELDQIIYIYIK